MPSTSASPTQITREQCIEIVRQELQSDKFSIKKFSLEPFEEMNGYLGEHSTLKIELGDQKTLTFFVKTLPKVVSQLAFLNEINGFFKEKQFFNKFCSALADHKIEILHGAVPKSYLATDEIIVLEDLTAQGYKTLTSREPLSLSCVQEGLKALAKFHASGLILQEFQHCKLTENFSEEMREGFYAGTEITTKAFNSCKHGIRALIDLTHTDSMKISQEEFTELAVEGLEKQKSFATISERFKNTICHADAWTKNVLFKFDGDAVSNCVLIDFQTYRYGPPAQDVMAFLYLVTDRELRDLHFEHLLKFYHSTLDDCLTRYGLLNYLPLGEFFANCDYFKQFAITQHITHFQVVTLSDEIVKELFADQKHAEYVTLENKYDFIVYACGKDPVYRKKLYGAINELREFYEKNNTIK